MINLYKTELSEYNNLTDYIDGNNIERDAEYAFHKKFIAIIAAFGLIFVATVIHIINWDQHSFSVIPLKISQTFGWASNQDLRELARICEDRMKYECSEHALREAAKNEPNVEDLIKLGNLQRKMNSYQNAKASYSSALALLKKSSAPNSTALSDSYYGLAKSFESVGQNDFALQNYDLAIKAKPEVIQITVTTSYLNLLKNIGKNDLAKTVIAEARKRGRSESLFSGIL